MRVMAPVALQLGIGISCVCPGLTQTPMMTTLVDGEDLTKEARDDRLRAVFKQLEAAGTPLQTPEIVGKSIAFLVQEGVKASGYSLFVQGGEVVELEHDLQSARPEWLSQRMSYMQRRSEWL